MTLDLTDDEKLALAAELNRAIAADRNPLSPRDQTLKAILVKLRTAVADPDCPGAGSGRRLNHDFRRDLGFLSRVECVVEQLLQDHQRPQRGFMSDLRYESRRPRKSNSREVLKATRSNRRAG